MFIQGCSAINVIDTLSHKSSFISFSAEYIPEYSIRFLVSETLLFMEKVWIPFQMDEDYTDSGILVFRLFMMFHSSGTSHRQQTIFTEVSNRW